MAKVKSERSGSEWAHQVFEIRSPAVTSNLALRPKSLHHGQSTDGKYSQVMNVPKSFIGRILPLTPLQNVLCRRVFAKPAPSKAFHGGGGRGGGGVLDPNQSD
jgi:hypothetical protein